MTPTIIRKHTLLVSARALEAEPPYQEIDLCAGHTVEVTDIDTGVPEVASCLLRDGREVFIERKWL